MIRSKVFLGTLSVVSALFAANYTWTGNGDASKWTDPANWGGSAYPTGGDTATFGANATISENFAIGAGTLTITVNSGKTVKLNGVVSGAGGIKKADAGVLYLHNAANTYTGATTLNGGTLYFYSLANIGEPSSFGAPAAADAKITCASGTTLWMEDQTSAYETDRPFEFGKTTTFRQPYKAVTVSLNGPITGGGVTFRGTGVFNIAQPLSSSFTSVGRTDDGTTNFLSPTNTFTVTPTISDGTFRGTIADAGVPSSLGKGTQISFGQNAYGTTGKFHYNGPTSTNCNRTLHIYVYTDGSYTTTKDMLGARIRNETAGTTLTMNGTLTLGYTRRDKAYPWLYVGGVGDGVLDLPLIDNVSLYKELEGTWTLLGENTTTGRVTVLGGRLDIDGSLVEEGGYSPKVAVGNNCTLGGTGTVHCTVQVSTGGTFAPGHADAPGTFTCGPGDFWFNANTKLNLRIGADGCDRLVSSGDVACKGVVTVNVSAFGVDAIPPGDYTLIEAASLTTANFSLGAGAPEGVQLFADARRLRLIVPNTAARQLTWTGAQSAAWDLATENWSVGGEPAAFAAHDSVLFDDSSVVSNVTLSTAVEPYLATVDSTNANYTLGGEGGLTGVASLVKTGPSTLVLDGAHDHVGLTCVDAGKLVLNGSFDGTSIRVADGATFDQRAGSVIAGDGISLVFGFGNNYLRGVNTFTGTVMVDMSQHASVTADNGLQLAGERPLGYAKSVVLKGFGSASDTCACVMLYPGTFVEDTTFIFQGSKRAYLRKQNVSGNTASSGWYGDLKTETGASYIQCFGGVFEIGRPGGTNVIEGSGFSFRGGGTIHCHSRINTPNGLNRDDGGTTVLYSTNNLFANTTVVQGYIQLAADNAWCKGAVLSLGKQNANGMNGFNLDGFNQTLPGLVEVQTNYAGKTAQRKVWTPEGKPATLTIGSDGHDSMWGGPLGYSYIEGPLTIVKRGSRPFVLYNKTTYTGSTVVEAGTLAALAADALSGTTNLTVKGGTTRLGTSTALNKEADVSFPPDSTGVIQLDEGVAQQVRCLYTGNSAHPRKPGTYGSSSSAAANKDDARFSGTGILIVRRGNGFSIVLR